MKLSRIKKQIINLAGTELLITLKFNEEGMLEDIDFSSGLSKQQENSLRKEILSWDFSAINIAPLSDVGIVFSL